MSLNVPPEAFLEGKLERICSGQDQDDFDLHVSTEVVLVFSISGLPHHACASFRSKEKVNEIIKALEDARDAVFGK